VRSFFDRKFSKGGFMDKKVNERQIHHLIEAMRQSGYYFGEKGGKPKLDLKFLKALQIFFLDSKGEDVRRTVNAFRTVCIETFKDVPETDFMSYEARGKVLEFLKKNMKPKKYKEAEKFLNGNPELLLAPSFPKVHPQKISELGELNFDFQFSADEKVSRGIESRV
jgi:hypothetical protein